MNPLCVLFGHHYPALGPDEALADIGTTAGRCSRCGHDNQHE